MSNLLDGNNQPAPASVAESLEAAVAAFKSAPATVEATNLIKAQLPTEAVALEAEEPALEEAEVPLVEEQEETEEEPSAFGEQFEATFGMKPDEAVALVNELSSFRDEVMLMRQWGVNAGEYDTRINLVKEFYSTLPEDSREQFNTPQGAIAIWNHLEQTGKTTAPSTSTRQRAKTSVRSAPKAPAVELIKRSDILAMDTATYNKNYARISKAYQEGRVLDNQ